MKVHPRDRILGKDKGSKALSEEDLPLIHHELMKEYGWIPLKELKELPLPTLWNLWNIIMSRRKEEQEEYERTKRKSRSRR